MYYNYIMVKSLLNHTIEYPEIKKIATYDASIEAWMYESSILGIDVIIALGSPNYTFIDDGIVYYNIYLIKNERVDIPIGVYELAADQVPIIMDEEGDIDLNKIAAPPLLFGSTTKSALQTILEEPSIKKVDPIKVLESEEVEEAVETNFSPLNLQTEEEAKNEISDFKNSEGIPWIQKYMHNNHYLMVDNEGKGDCLFATIRDGLKRIGRVLTVAAMRKIIADNATQDLFVHYRKLYDDAVVTDIEIATESKNLMDRHKDLVKKMEDAKIHTSKISLAEQAADVAKRHTIVKSERKANKELIHELAFMKKVKTLAHFKAVVQTCAFSGETWAISTLERVLSIKLIIFSEPYYRAKDLDNVLQCGQLNDDVDTFTPSHYIMIIHQGAHYQLVTYKKRGAFTFESLPYDVKMLVVDKCLERLAGPYYIIPEFRKLMEKVKGIESDVAVVEPEPEPEPDLQPDFYDKNGAVVQFYSGSVGKPMPGQGGGEKLGADTKEQYSELVAIPDWRKKLSNFWLAPFQLDGMKWSSVEHYYQASKFKRGHPEFYKQFSLNFVPPTGELATNPLLAKNAGGKSNSKKIRPKDVSVDKDFFASGRHIKEMEAAMRAKFSQNADLKKMLLATKKAKLQHFSRGMPPKVFNDLMRIRQEMIKK